MVDFTQKLTEQIEKAQKKYIKSGDACDFNEVRKKTKALAHHLLVQKAVSGSTHSIVELSKSFNFTPDFNYSEDVIDQMLKYDDLTSDQLDAIERRLQIGSKPLSRLTGENVIEEYQKGRLSYLDAQRALNILKLKQDIDFTNKNEGRDKMEIFLCKEILDAV